MSAASQFYTDQAAICAASAEDAPLDNQRDKYLKAREAWLALAKREEQIIAAREKREAEKAEALAEEKV